MKHLFLQSHWNEIENFQYYLNTYSFINILILADFVRH